MGGLHDRSRRKWASNLRFRRFEGPAVAACRISGGVILDEPLGLPPDAESHRKPVALLLHLRQAIHGIPVLAVVRVADLAPVVPLGRPSLQVMLHPLTLASGSVVDSTS